MIIFCNAYVSSVFVYFKMRSEKELLIKENHIVDKLKTKDEIKLISLKIDYYNLYSFTSSKARNNWIMTGITYETKEEIISIEYEKLKEFFDSQVADIWLLFGSTTLKVVCNENHVISDQVNKV
ncbi:unnamed protein product [Rhizophagus irregularis]|nr:unnamed protein product [Rhizophagus irregularis]